MRLWSLHPAHLDRQGLTACWREGLLAQAVLAGRTKGYTHHPQLDRFRASGAPLGAVTAYLDAVQAEASARGYSYDPTRIDAVPRFAGVLKVAEGQLALEWAHLLAKLAARSPDWHAEQAQRSPTPHPLFQVMPGGPEPWERAPQVLPTR